MTENVTNVWGGSKAETTVTIKYGKGYEESWVVFRGSPDEIRAQLIGYFAPEPETVEGLSLHELVLNLTKLAHSTSAASSGLGGTVINNGGRAQRPSSGGWAAAAAEPAVPERNPLYGKVESATTLDEVKDIYARNADAFKADAELLAAWKAKGKELSAK